MSEPTQNQNFEDPPDRLVTDNGTVWTIRDRTHEGGLYAPEHVKRCPVWVLAEQAVLESAHGARAFTIPTAGDAHLLVQAHDVDPMDAAYRALAPTAEIGVAA